MVDTDSQPRLLEILGFCDALIDAMRSSLSVDPKNMLKYTGYKDFARKYNGILIAAQKVIEVDAPVDLYKIEALPHWADAVIAQQQNYFESVFANLLILRSYLAQRAGVAEDEVAKLRDFLRSSLRRAMLREPAQETDVQDLIEQILIWRGFEKGTDYDRETGRVKISLKESIPDFIFPKIPLALEVKLAKSENKSRLIIDEINADILAYSKKYRRILFVVYDLGTIRDEEEFRRDLEAIEGVSV